MTRSNACANRRSAAFTVVEVLVASVLIAVGLCGILAMNAKSAHTLRATRVAAASSLVLQQRIETIRGKPWPEISNANALRNLMRTPMESEREIPDPDVIEYVKVCVPTINAAGELGEGASFSVWRQRGTAYIEAVGDFGNEPTLLFASYVTWCDNHGRHLRHLRTLVCRAGLTRSGVFGSSLGNPGVGFPAE
jgi:hypothetical protein